MLHTVQWYPGPAFLRPTLENIWSSLPLFQDAWNKTTKIASDTSSITVRIFTVCVQEWMRNLVGYRFICHISRIYLQPIYPNQHSVGRYLLINLRVITAYNLAMLPVRYIREMCKTQSSNWIQQVLFYLSKKYTKYINNWEGYATTNVSTTNNFYH